MSGDSFALVRTQREHDGTATIVTGQRHIAGSMSKRVFDLGVECAALGARISIAAPALVGPHRALELHLATLAAMCARSRAASQSGCVPGLPDEALSLQASAVEQQLRELVVTAAGYAALPAPDAERSHNRKPLASEHEANAVQALMAFHARDEAYQLRRALALKLYGDDVTHKPSSCSEDA